jgi:hypothetical protein
VHSSLLAADVRREAQTIAMRSRRYRFGPASGFVGALLFMAIGLALYFGIRVLVKPPSYDLTGTIQLKNDNVTTSGLPSGYSCAGATTATSGREHLSRSRMSPANSWPSGCT